MKLRRLLFFGALAGAVAAILKKQRSIEPAAPEGIWKPVDPLRPYGARDTEQP